MSRGRDGTSIPTLPHRAPSCQPAGARQAGGSTAIPFIDASVFRKAKREAVKQIGMEF